MSSAARGHRSPVVILGVCAALAALGCDSERARLKQTTKPTYDTATGKLTELTYDANQNGRIDTWTEMDGSTPLRSRIDSNEDGRIDRWEYYDAAGKVSKLGFVRNVGAAAPAGSTADKPDAWAYPDATGAIERIEISATGNPARITRREYYDAARAPSTADPSTPGHLLRVEEDSNGDGRIDKWERYVNDQVETAEFDENGDGRPDRRLTYKEARLVLIETAPDDAGRYTKSLTPE